MAFPAALGIGLAVLVFLGLSGGGEAKAAPKPAPPPPPTGPKPYGGACLLDANIPPEVKVEVLQTLARDDLDIYDFSKAADVVEKLGFPLAAGCIRAHGLTVQNKRKSAPEVPKPAPPPEPVYKPSPTTPTSVPGGGPTGRLSCEQIRASYWQAQQAGMLKLNDAPMAAVVVRERSIAQGDTEARALEHAKASSDMVVAEAKRFFAQAESYKVQLAARGCGSP